MAALGPGEVAEVGGAPVEVEAGTVGLEVLVKLCVGVEVWITGVRSGALIAVFAGPGVAASQAASRATHRTRRGIFIARFMRTSQENIIKSTRSKKKAFLCV